MLLVTGDEDRTTSARRRRAISAALRAPRDVCVDLSQLRFADPSLMLDLAVLAQRLRAEGLAVRLRRPQPQIRTLIELVGLDRQPAVAVDSRVVRNVGGDMRFLLVLIFIVVPIAELALLIQVGQAIGVWWTIALLVADSILGSLLMRSQGRAAWRRFNVALQAGRPPAREVLDGVLVIFGGALLLTPGFISDFLGLAAAAAAHARGRAGGSSCAASPTA